MATKASLSTTKASLTASSKVTDLFGGKPVKPAPMPVPKASSRSVGSKKATVAPPTVKPKLTVTETRPTAAPKVVSPVKTSITVTKAAPTVLAPTKVLAPPAPPPPPGTISRPPDLSPTVTASTAVADLFSAKPVVVSMPTVPAPAPTVKPSLSIFAMPSSSYLAPSSDSTTSKFSDRMTASPTRTLEMAPAPSGMTTGLLTAPVPEKTPLAPSPVTSLIKDIATLVSPVKVAPTTSPLEKGLLPVGARLPTSSGSAPSMIFKPTDEATASKDVAALFSAKPLSTLSPVSLSPLAQKTAETQKPSILSSVLSIFKPTIIEGKAEDPAASVTETAKSEQSAAQGQGQEQVSYGSGPAADSASYGAGGGGGGAGGGYDPGGGGGGDDLAPVEEEEEPAAPEASAPPPGTSSGWKWLAALGVVGAALWIWSEK